MNDFDRAGEYLRVRDHYRRLTNGELLSLFRQQSELTDVAQQALTSKISSPGLRAEPEEPAAIQRPQTPTDIPDRTDSNYDEDKRLVTLRMVWSLADALQLQGLLDMAGIPFYIGPEKATPVDALTSNFADGLDVQIMPIGTPWARQGIPDYKPANDQAHGGEEITDEAPVRCPKCSSGEVVPAETSPGGKEGDSPELFRWTCDACGYHWEDEGIEQTV